MSSTVYRGVLISGCWYRGVPLYTEVSSFQWVGIAAHFIQRRHINSVPPLGQIRLELGVTSFQGGYYTRICGQPIISQVVGQSLEKSYNNNYSCVLLLWDIINGRYFL